MGQDKWIGTKMTSKASTVSCCMGLGKGPREWMVAQRKVDGSNNGQGLRDINSKAKL